MANAISVASVTCFYMFIAVEGYLKSGYCPISSGQVKEEGSFCKMDSDCPADLKCCPTVGVYECVNPTKFFGRKHALYCPNDILPDGGRECAADNDCPDMEKCCPSFNAMRCTEAKNEIPGPKTGVCPKGINEASEVGKLCMDDYECLGYLKCCFNGLNFRCTSVRAAASTVAIPPEPVQVQPLNRKVIKQA
ncbi:WAP-type 'four-disulfide core [Trichuris suis]|nr:WAP-type 'four-disulfide core [Trichuris suis]